MANYESLFQNKELRRISITLYQNIHLLLLIPALELMQKQSGTSSFPQFFRLLYLLPLILTGATVLSFGVNVPFLDQWSIVDSFSAATEGTLTLEQLWTQHNEHRIIIPRLVFLGLGLLSKWNNLLEMLFSVFLTGVVLVILSVLNENTLTQLRVANRLPLDFALFVSGLILFSLSQYENWFWGFQVIFFLVQAFVALAVLVLTTEYVCTPLNKFSIAALLCFAASLSGAQGLLSWLSMLPLIATLPKTLKNRLLLSLLWLGLFAATTALYLYQYQPPSAEYIPDRLYALKHPVQAGKFLMVLIGSLFTHVNSVNGRDVLTMTTVTGGVFLVSFLLLTINVFRTKTFDIYKPWIALGIFGLLFVSMIMVGRSGWGVGGALISRYTTASTFLLVSVVQMAAFTFNDRRSRLKFYGYFIVLVLICSMIFTSSAPSLVHVKESQHNRKTGQVCLELINYISPVLDNTPQGCIWQLFPLQGDTFPKFIRKRSELLGKMGFRKLAKDVRFVETASPELGMLQRITASEGLLPPTDQVLRLSGWAILPDHRRVPEAIAISLNDQKTFLTAVRPDQPSPDVALRMGDTRYTNSTWVADIPLEPLPNGINTFKAWAYDSQNRQFIRLAEPDGQITLLKH